MILGDRAGEDLWNHLSLLRRQSRDSEFVSAPVQRSYRTYPFAIPTVHLSTEPPLLIRLKARVVPHPACRLTTGDRPVACRSTSPSLSSSWFWCVRRQICPCGVARFNANPLFIYFIRYFFKREIN